MVYLREIDILFDCVQCVVQSYLARPYLKELAYSVLLERMQLAGFGISPNQIKSSATGESEKDGLKDEWNNNLK